MPQHSKAESCMGAFLIPTPASPVNNQIRGPPVTRDSVHSNPCDRRARRASRSMRPRSAVVSSSVCAAAARYGSGAVHAAACALRWRCMQRCMQRCMGQGMGERLDVGLLRYVRTVCDAFPGNSGLLVHSDFHSKMSPASVKSYSARSCR